jgi:hypothetical protein
MKVGSLTLHRNSEQIINVHISTRTKESWVLTKPMNRSSQPTSICGALLIGCNVPRRNGERNQGSASYSASFACPIPAARQANKLLTSAVRWVRAGYNVTDDTAR